MKLGELIEVLGGKLVAGDPEHQVDGRELCRAGRSLRSWSLPRMRPRRPRRWPAVPAWLCCGPGLRKAVSARQVRRRGRSAAPVVCAGGQAAQACAACHRSASRGGRWRECEARRRRQHRPLRGGRREGQHRRGTRIEAGAVIGEGVRIGDDCRIYPRAVLYPGTTLGNRVIVHAGAVLGADGFGYVRDEKTGAYTQFPQQGTLLIEDDVEIGANTTIDRGALKQTKNRPGNQDG